MREWFRDNTSISLEEYDRIFQYKDAPEDLRTISHDPKKLALLQIEFFTLRPTFIGALKYGIKREQSDYSYHGYHFRLFSDYYNDKRLKSTDRFGQCIKMSVYFALQSSLDIATFLCTDFRDYRCLHSALIGRDNRGKAYILDYTRNLIMPKEEYDDLLDVEEVAFLSNDDLKYLHRLSKAYPTYFDNFDLFEIACFSKEIIEAASRDLNQKR